MPRFILLSRLTRPDIPVWPREAIQAMQELGVTVIYEYSLTGNGPHNFLHVIDYPIPEIETRIIEVLEPCGVEGEVYLVKG